MPAAIQHGLSVDNSQDSFNQDDIEPNEDVLNQSAEQQQP